jgi:hypothetical protein
MADRRARWGALLVAAALLIVTGCAGVPTSGELKEADENQLDEVRGADTFQQLPGPQKGASAEDIVRDFADAMYTYEAGYIAARQFLTDAAANEWDPSVINISKYKMEFDRDKLTLKYTVIAKVVDNVYIDVPDEEVKHELHLSTVDGERRIRNPPEGMIMSEADFHQEFNRYDRYFWDPTYQFLVPDSVFIPSGNRSKIQTLLTNALLDGPSEALEPGIRTAFPQGTTLTGNTAPVDDNNTAVVDLSVEAAQATRDEVEWMVAQLAWTLTQVAGVVDVNTTAGGTLLYEDEPVTRADFSSFDATKRVDASTPLYGITDEGLSLVDADGLASTAPGPLGTTPGLLEVAVSPESGQAVAVDDTGEQLVMASLDRDAELQAIFTGTDLSSLAWDSLGTIWVLDTDDDGTRVVTMTPDGRSSRVDVPGLDDGTIEAFAVSPDGTRAAFVIDGVAEVRTVVRPGRTTGPIEVVNGRAIADGVTDLDWYDSTSLALLTRPSDQPPTPVIADMTIADRSSDWQEFDPVEDAVSIAAAMGRISGGVVVATEDNAAYILTADGLDELPPLRAPAFPG